MISARSTFFRRALHTTPRLGAQKPFEKGGDEAAASATSGKTHVVSEPVESEKPFGVPSGVYSGGTPLKGDATKASSTFTTITALPRSSSSASPAHPTTSKQAQNDELAERNAWPSEKEGQLGRDEAARQRK
ncbi:hypothetical protein RhiJN_17354 [Ceratobasidium sp. AG-Ba]|nr:hypothetical protein RhiJN_17354 [Ceratobasidium sp. AG-Ba]